MLNKTVYTIYFLFSISLIWGQSVGFANIEEEFKKIDSLAVIDDVSSEILSHNQIVNRDALLPFFEKLTALNKIKEGKINIVHIGDSHIQADLFTGKIREILQAEFGNAGLGFSFPYRLAKTNGNYFVKYSSNINWDNHRNVFPVGISGGVVGLSGISLSTSNKNFFIEINVSDPKYRFTKMKIYTPYNEKMFDVATSDRNIIVKQPVSKSIKHKIKNGETISGIAKKYGITQEKLKKVNNLKNNKIRAGKTLNIPSKVKEFKPVDRSLFIPQQIITEKEYHEFINESGLQKIYLLPDKSADRFNLNGLVFENDNSGIIYHSIGVNGAKYSDYNKNILFFDQVKALEPDLIIVSLGTNESFDKMEPADYHKQMEFFIKEIKERNPNVNILVTTPPPSLFKKKYNNYIAEGYADSILEAASSQGFAVWDMFHLLGGSTKIKENYKNGLLAGDYIHYSKKGYEYTGELFAEALLAAFKNFKPSEE